MKIKLPLMLVAAGLLAAGCDQQRNAANDRSINNEKDSIQKSVRDAKSEVDKEAKAQKEMLDAESKAAQAKLDAEKARLKAESTDAQAKVDAASQNIRDAAGSADATVQRETGAAASTAPERDAARATGTDGSLADQVRKAIKGEGTDPDATASAANVEVTESDGVVTLKGTVRSDADKARMEAAAKAVSGVSRVDNQLEIKAE